MGKQGPVHQAEELTFYSGMARWILTYAKKHAQSRLQEKSLGLHYGGWSEEDALWRQRNNKGLNQGSVCRDGMLGTASRAIKEVKLAGHGN